MFARIKVIEGEFDRIQPFLKQTNKLDNFGDVNDLRDFMRLSMKSSFNYTQEKKSAEQEETVQKQGGWFGFGKPNSQKKEDKSKCVVGCGVDDQELEELMDKYIKQNCKEGSKLARQIKYRL